MDNFPAIRPLFLGLEKAHALVQAVTVGRLPARVLVDDASSPSAGVMVYKSRILCGGAGAKSGLVRVLADWFFAELIPAHLNAGNDAFLVYYSGDEWKTVLEEMFKPYKIFHRQRQYYEINDFQPAASVALPEGYSIQMITREFMSSGLKGLDAIREEMCSERLSVDDFLDYSFGLCPINDGEIAGWCMSEYNVDRRCEIGIATLEKHQQKGIATLAARHFLTKAYQLGYTRVGWDCWKSNIASGATARKAGLRLVEEYPAMVVFFERDASQH
jgi:GNAT superfamily N-acetyltransferase